MTGKSLESIAALLMEKFLVVVGAGGAAVQVTTGVPLKFGVSAFNQQYNIFVIKTLQYLHCCTGSLQITSNKLHISFTQIGVLKISFIQIGGI